MLMYFKCLIKKKECLILVFIKQIYFSSASH